MLFQNLTMFVLIPVHLQLLAFVLNMYETYIHQQKMLYVVKLDRVNQHDIK